MYLRLGHHEYSIPQQWKTAIAGILAVADSRYAYYWVIEERDEMEIFVVTPQLVAFFHQLEKGHMPDFARVQKLVEEERQQMARGEWQLLMADVSGPWPSCQFHHITGDDPLVRINRLSHGKGPYYIKHFAHRFMITDWEQSLGEIEQCHRAIPADSLEEMQFIVATQEHQPVAMAIVLDEQVLDVWVIRACRTTMVGFQLLAHVHQFVEIKN